MKDNKSCLDMLAEAEYLSIKTRIDEGDLQVADILLDNMKTRLDMYKKNVFMKKDCYVTYEQAYNNLMDYRTNGDDAA